MYFKWDFGLSTSITGFPDKTKNPEIDFNKQKPFYNNGFQLTDPDMTSNLEIFFGQLKNPRNSRFFNCMHP